MAHEREGRNEQSVATQSIVEAERDRAAEDAGGLRPKFAVGQMVTCKYKGVDYKAKVLRWRQKDDGTLEYKIHYNKWNARYDSWVDEGRLTAVQGVQRESRGEASNGRKSQPNSTVPIIHRITGYDILAGLKEVLEVDEERVRHGVVKLPADETAAAILNQYAETFGSDMLRQEMVLMHRQVDRFFGRYCRGWILYAHERAQFDQICAERPDVPLTDILGFIHLVRLLYVLPELLQYSISYDEIILIIMQKFRDFERFLDARREQFFPRVIYVEMPESPGITT